MTRRIEIDDDEVVVIYGIDGMGNRMPERVFTDWQKAESWRDEQPDSLAYGMVTAPVGFNDE